MSEPKLKSCRNKNWKKEYVVALTGYRNAAYVRPVRTTGRRFATLVVNMSYRRYAVGRTTSVVAYVRQTLVNSLKCKIDSVIADDGPICLLSLVQLCVDLDNNSVVCFAQVCMRRRTEWLTTICTTPYITRNFWSETIRISITHTGGMTESRCGSLPLSRWEQHAVIFLHPLTPSSFLTTPPTLSKSVNSA